ncbi:hypothetical protein FAIPA1_210026 [Frankia sp. AiPs1]|nr:hypothetical protein [Frankia sp. AiPa1]
MDAIGEWSVIHASEIIAARERFDERAVQPPAPLPVSVPAAR